MKTKLVWPGRVLQALEDDELCGYVVTCGRKRVAYIPILPDEAGEPPALTLLNAVRRAVSIARKPELAKTSAFAVEIGPQNPISKFWRICEIDRTWRTIFPQP